MLPPPRTEPSSSGGQFITWSPYRLGYCGRKFRITCDVLSALVCNSATGGREWQLYYSTNCCAGSCTTAQTVVPAAVLQHKLLCRQLYYSTNCCAGSCTAAQTVVPAAVLQHKLLCRRLYCSTNCCAGSCTAAQTVVPAAVLQHELLCRQLYCSTNCCAGSCTAAQTVDCCAGGCGGWEQFIVPLLLLGPVSLPSNVTGI